MSGFIDLTSSTYSNLSQFGVLANTAMTSTGTTTVNSGLWGIPSGAVIPNMAVGTLPSGPATGAQAAAAQSELTTLITSINVKTSTLTTTTLGPTPGNYTFLPNINYINTPANGITFTDNALTFDASGNSDAQFFITVHSDGPGYLEFTRTSFNLINGARACNIFFLTNTYIVHTHNDATFSPLYGIFISGTYFTITRHSSVTGHVYAKTAFTATAQTTGTTINTSTCGEVLCYAKGTLILTQRGLVPIEKLKAGQSIITKGKINYNKYHSKNANIKAETLLWVSKFKVVDLNSKSRPICIKKNALGENMPFKDLYVSPGHGLLLDGHMVRANNLINGKTIYQDNECRDVEYYHVELDSHSAVFANGILSESYLAVNNRHVFENSISLRPKPKQTSNLKNILALR